MTFQRLWKSSLISVHPTTPMGIKLRAQWTSMSSTYNSGFLGLAGTAFALAVGLAAAYLAAAAGLGGACGLAGGTNGLAL